MRSWLGLFSIAIVACGKESVERPQPLELTVISPRPSATPAPPEGPPKEPEGPHLLPLVDAQRGEEAVATFRRWLAATCIRLRPSNLDRASELQRIGLPDADVQTLCLAPEREGVAIASRGRDVVVEGPSGGDGASGPRALFMVGAERKIPSVTMLAIGPSFEALARIAVPDHDDVVMLFTKNGRQGLYYGECGFLGEGSFQKRPKPSEDELRTTFSTTCGESEGVTAGAPSLRGEMLEVPLTVEKVRHTRDVNDADEPCPKRQRVAHERFSIHYRLERGRFVRLTPTPKAAERVLAKY